MSVNDHIRAIYYGWLNAVKWSVVYFHIKYSWLQASEEENCCRFTLASMLLIYIPPHVSEEAKKNHISPYEQQMVVVNIQNSFWTTQIGAFGRWQHCAYAILAIKREYVDVFKWMSLEILIRTMLKVQNVQRCRARAWERLSNCLQRDVRIKQDWRHRTKLVCQS